MALGRRQLFIYWHVDGAQAQQALQAMRAWQQRLQSAHPALRPGLFLRHDAAPGVATVMESYAVDAAESAQGVDAKLQQHIEQDGTAVLQPWLRGTRHVELFEAFDA